MGAKENMWKLLWVLLTPGGDMLHNGIMSFNTRTECNAQRVRIENQPMPLGQKVQAICIERESND